jgi:hypothetical protein
MNGLYEAWAMIDHSVLIIRGSNFGAEELIGGGWCGGAHS